MVEIGTVLINSDNEKFVVTEVTDGVITEKKRLEDYVASTVLVRIGDEMKSIKSIVDHYSNGYLHENETVYID